jgi:hypothetical protein
VERDRELCPAFLTEDFEAAAREADAAVREVRELVAEASRMVSADGLIGNEPLRTWLYRQPAWRDAQRAIQWQFRARAALEQTGLPLPPDARAAGERAQSEFLALGNLVAQEDERT